MLKTICYADIFDFPLNIEEIHKWLIAENSNQVITKKIIKEQISNIPSIKQTHDYYYLKSRKNLISFRKKREKYSQEKLKIAKRAGKWLKIIPTVKAVAVTGALAMNNVKKEDDIDLMIITSANRLWLTRLVVIPLISTIAKRRTPLKQFNNLTINQFSNTICLNLWLDETVLQVPKEKQNLYTAHETAQTIFLWSRDNIEKIFLSQNSWISKHLPNIKINKKLKGLNKKRKKTLLYFFELIAYKLQLLYMRNKKTREIVTPHSAFFHPRDTGKIILKNFKQKLSKYSIN